MFKKKILLLAAVLLCGAALWAAPAQPSAPLIVGGNFSSQTNLPVQTKVFNQAARNAEIASLNNQLKQKHFTEVIRRINDLTAKNFLDNRFHLLLAIAYDGLGKYDDVIYSAGQAIAVAPQDSRAYILRGGAYMQLGDYERARIDVDTALKLNPSSRLAQKLQSDLDEKMSIKRVQEPAQPTQKNLLRGGLPSIL